MSVLAQACGHFRLKYFESRDLTTWDYEVERCTVSLECVLAAWLEGDADSKISELRNGEDDAVLGLKNELASYIL